jgi:hypothetical protein
MLRLAAEPERWIRVTAPPSAWSALSPACPSRYRVITWCTTFSTGVNSFDALWPHGSAVVHAVLQAELDPQQAQEVPHLRRGGDRARASAATQPLLDGHRRRDAVDGIHLGPAGRLHDGASIVRRGKGQRPISDRVARIFAGDRIPGPCHSKTTLAKPTSMIDNAPSSSHLSR